MGQRGSFGGELSSAPTGGSDKTGWIVREARPCVASDAVELSLGDASGSGEVGIVEAGAKQEGVREVCFGEVGVGEVGSPRLYVVEVGFSEVAFGEVSADQLSAG